MRRRWVCLVFVAALVLRTVALSSDAYSRLDWSAGLLTDEGFYVHNARNVALFGHPRTDEFNNMLLAPLLHLLQVGVFSAFGVGVIQARAISVACSLLTLWLLWAALRRPFGERVALTAVLFLAVDHTSLLYNRMALLDTPAALPAVGAFYAFVRACDACAGNQSSVIRDSRFWWLALCGVLLGVTATNRMLAAYIVPAPFVALWFAADMRRGILGLLAGLAVVLTAYGVLWYWPNRLELGAMNAYYRSGQLQPRSVAHLVANVRQAIFGDHRGISPYLMRHTPVVYLLVVGWLAAAFGRWVAGAFGRSGSEGPQRVVEPPPSKDDPAAQRPGGPTTQRPATVYLMVWFTLGWLALAVISYSPSRYYVTLYPAMASLAAVALWRLPALMERASGAPPWARLAAAAVAAFAVFHCVLAVVHYRGVLPAPVSRALLFAVPAIVAAGVLAGWSAGSGGIQRLKRAIVPSLLVLWLALNGTWMADWVARLDYTQIRLSQWLGENLPEGSVLIGDLAPGVTMNNRFKAIHVQPGLANGERPVERFAGSPRFVAVLAGRWKEKYWAENYPHLLAPERLVRLARVLRWDVGIYSVDHPIPRRR